MKIKVVRTRVKAKETFDDHEHFKLVVTRLRGEKILATAEYGYNPINAYLSDFDVTKNCRGRGIGTKLCRLAVEHIEEVMETRPPAQLGIFAPLHPTEEMVEVLSRILGKHGFRPEDYGWRKPAKDEE
ncbi:MAG: GNAT family N-acetyltransferase [Candidatus Diapherotrites archaeon]|nr:GNAT family N-acetyltransferase [Candidatus Diapherotrites archaeon]